jgi:glycosyltransferase involved in cell wall biosynthesis
MAVNGTAYLISLKFAPGLMKEFLLLGENIRKQGIDVRYILSKNYRKLGEGVEGITYIPMKEGIKGMVLDTFRFFNGDEFIQILSSEKPSYICFYNPHPLNPRLAYLVKKKFPKTLLALYLHDPYKPDKSPYGLAKSLYITVAEFIQGLTIRYMDYVISPSEYSSNLFKQRYPDFKGENYIAPLLVPDRRKDEAKRQYFSIVGTAHQATGHDTFIELVNYAAEKNLSYEFALISSSNIDMFLSKLSEKAKKILKVINNKIIPDSEINKVIRESYAVFRLDREVTQSGVVPVSYMNETPVISREIPGLTQHVWHEKTGYIVPFKCSPEDLVKAMNHVRNNFTKLSGNARKSYEDIWAEGNWDKYYKWLVDLLK